MEQRLEELQSLRARGMISEEEYAAARKSALGIAPSPPLVAVGVGVDEHRPQPLRPQYSSPIVGYPADLKGVEPEMETDTQLAPEELAQAELYADRIRVSCLFQIVLSFVAIGAVLGSWGLSVAAGSCVATAALCSCISLSDLRRVDPQTEQCCCRRPCVVWVHYVGFALCCLSTVGSAITLSVLKEELRDGTLEFYKAMFYSSIVALCTSVLMGLLTLFVIAQFHYLRQVVTAHARSLAP